MSTPRLDDREIEMIVLALRFWRAQRRTGETRRSDSSFVSPDAVDLLLAKLQSRRLRRIAREAALLADSGNILSR